MYMDFRAISDASLVIVFVLLYFAAPYFSGEAGLIAFRFLFATLGAVSYTHLTLPTTPYV